VIAALLLTGLVIAALLLLARLLAGLIALLLLARLLIGILVLVLTHDAFLQRWWLSMVSKTTFETLRPIK
jgi:hypothetical protein